MKKILISLLIIGAVFAAISGATMAYFSDTATSTGNTFAAGTLDFNIKAPDTTSHQVFNVTGMKPGEIKTGYIVVTNDSTQNMDMKWHAWVSGSGALGDVLQVKITMNPSDYTSFPTGYTKAGPVNHPICDYTALGNLGNGNNIMVWQNAAGPFSPNWAAVYKFEVKMADTAGNEFQNLTYSGDINFYATQFENTGW